MNKIKNYLLCFIVLGNCFMLSAKAQTKDPDAYALMTVRDMRGNTDLSNITLINRTGQSVTASGLYIASFDVNDCSACTGNVLGGDNAGGAVLSSVTFKANQAVPIGQNYLYNMMYNGLYYVRQNIGSPCALPGCSWPGDNPGVTGWCITINVMSLDSGYTYSNFTNGAHPPAKSLAYAVAGVSTPFDYKYALINPATLGAGNACLGPIVCNDKTLTCKIDTPQNESFQAY